MGIRGRGRRRDSRKRGEGRDESKMKIGVSKLDAIGGIRGNSKRE